MLDLSHVFFLKEVTMSLNFQQLNEILNILHTTSVLCVGDMMMDEYVSGPASRLSPEAPVPVILKKNVRQVLGGVGNVAANLSELGCMSTVFYAVADDQEGQRIREMLEQRGIISYPHIISSITTKKQRIISQKQQICRIDSEEPLILTKQQEDKIVHQVTSLLPQHNVVILSDYNKGFISPRVAQGIIKAAAMQSKPVLVDPKGSDYSKYSGATLIKPNLSELKTAVAKELGSSIPSELNPATASGIQNIQQAAHILCNQLHIQQAVVTLGEHGMIGTDKKFIYRPTTAKAVSDVSGAGDTSLAVLAASLGIGASLENAMDLANIGAGIVVAKEGTATLSHAELNDSLKTLFNSDATTFYKGAKPTDYTY